MLAAVMDASAGIGPAFAERLAAVYGLIGVQCWRSAVRVTGTSRVASTGRR